MPPAKADGSRSHIGAEIPTNHKEALFLLAKYRSVEQRENVTFSDLVRDYIEAGLKAEEKLPEEVADLLDEDMLANAGGEKDELEA